MSQNFVYKQKRQEKLLKSRLLFKKIADFAGKLLPNLWIVRMRNIQNAFETHKHIYQCFSNLHDCTLNWQFYFFWPNLSKGISGRKRKNCSCACVHRHKNHWFMRFSHSHLKRAKISRFQIDFNKSRVKL